MKHWHFARALTENGWVENFVVTTDSHGNIIETKANQAFDKDQLNEESDGWLIPGFVSAHSHAFQYAMAGVSEFLGTGHQHDDFWSWRSAMYQLALSIEPDQIRAIAEMVYCEMLRYGITHVAEFHYLHHDPHGKPYAKKNEMSAQLIAAANAVGIQLCIVPVYYRTGNFFEPASSQQRRFIFNGAEQYFDLVEELRKDLLEYPQHRLGVGVHSLRAAPPDDIKDIYTSVNRETPFHIHVAEQRKEVEACSEKLGKTPVRWLLDNLDVDERVSMVHVTHTTPDEISDLAASRATVVICPSTEANLGDGHFSFEAYYEAQGRWTIGTDSQISLNPMEDLRWIDYHQRLRREKRNTLCRGSHDDSGRILYHKALLGGRQSFGIFSDRYFAPGHAFSGIVLNHDHPLFAAKPLERILSCLVYSGDPTCFKAVISHGAWQVQEGHHRSYARAAARYRTALRQIISPRK